MSNHPKKGEGRHASKQTSGGMCIGQLIRSTAMLRGKQFSRHGKNLEQQTDP